MRNSSNSSRNFNSDLADYHFKFVVLFNCFLFLLYSLYRIFMAMWLVVVEKQNFFFDHLFVHEKGFPHHTLFRVFIPVFLFIGSFYLYFRLFKKTGFERVVCFFRETIRFNRSGLLRYVLFLFLSFGALSFIPGFTLLIRNLTTQYARIDINSYVNIVALMYRGDYNTSVVPDGGLQFIKYYILTLPTLILTLIFGIGNVIAAYNITVTLLVFFTILNVGFIFRNLFLTGRDRTFGEIGALLFIGALMIFSLRFVIFKDFFNYNVIVHTYSYGFYGALGAAYLFTCVLLMLSYLLRDREINFEKSVLIFLLTTLFGGMLGQAYFHFIPFLLPSSGVILAVLLSRKTSKANTLKFTALFLAYLVLSYGGYIALDIFPSYSINPIRKLNTISIGLLFSFGALLLLNRWLNDLPLKVFLKFRSWFLVVSFSAPFFWYDYTSNDLERINLLGYSIKLGSARVYFLCLLLYILLLGYMIFWILKNLLLRKGNYFVCGLIVGFFLLSLFVSCAHVVGQRPSLDYPAFYPEADRIENRENLYAFDESGFRVTYNKYLTDVIRYFVREGVRDMRYWIVSETPSLGIYEHGLFQCVLLSRGHNVEGVTVKRFDDEERDLIPEWAKMQLSEAMIEDYDDFAQHIFDIEKETRPLEEKFKNRYVIIDNNFPENTISLLDAGSSFHKVYENRLYKVYKMGSI